MKTEHDGVTGNSKATEPEAKKPLVFLKGKTTTLRPLLESDVPTLMRWINDPDLRVYLKRAMPCLEGEEREWVNRGNKNHNNVSLIIEVDGKPIGTMGIHGINWIDRTGTTGAVIGEKEYHGKGYGTDAKMALLEYAFDVLNLRKIYSSVLAYNKRSLRYSLHTGYVIEGVFKKDTFKCGKYHDIISLAITRSQWLPQYRLWKRGKKLPSKYVPSRKTKKDIRKKS